MNKQVKKTSVSSSSLSSLTLPQTSFSLSTPTSQKNKTNSKRESNKFVNKTSNTLQDERIVCNNVDNSTNHIKNNNNYYYYYYSNFVSEVKEAACL